MTLKLLLFRSNAWKRVDSGLAGRSYRPSLKPLLFHAMGSNMRERKSSDDISREVLPPTHQQLWSSAHSDNRLESSNRFSGYQWTYFSSLPQGPARSRAELFLTSANWLSLLERAAKERDGINCIVLPDIGLGHNRHGSNYRIYGWNSMGSTTANAPSSQNRRPC